MEQKKWSEALNELEYARKLDAINFEIERLAEEIYDRELFDKANLAISTRDHQEAEKIYKEILQKHTDHPLALHRKAFSELRVSKLSIDNQEKALNCFQQAQKAFQQKDYIQSITQAHEALSLYPDFPSGQEVRNKVLQAVTDLIMAAKHRLEGDAQGVEKQLPYLQKLVEVCGYELEKSVYEEFIKIQDYIKNPDQDTIQKKNRFVRIFTKIFKRQQK